MAELPQIMVGWGPTSNGLGVLGVSPGWPEENGTPWLPDHLRTFLPRGSDAEVMRGLTPPHGLEARPTPHGNVLSAKTYLGRVGRPGTFVAHALLDTRATMGPVDLLGAIRRDLLWMREEQPASGPLPRVEHSSVRRLPAPEDAPRDLLEVLLGRMADGRPLLMHTADRHAGLDFLEILGRALPKKVAASMWWSGFVAQPAEAAHLGPGLGLVVQPFSELALDATRPEDPDSDAMARLGVLDLDRGSPTASDRARALAVAYLDHPASFADARDVHDFVERLEALVLDPTEPVDERVLGLLGQDVGPAVFARLVTGGKGMSRLDEIGSSGRRLPFGRLWAAVPHLPAPMYDWFGPVRAPADQQAEAQGVITATMDTRNLSRLVTRPLARQVDAFRPVVADPRLATSMARTRLPAAACEWRVLPETWQPVVTELVADWLAGRAPAPDGLAELAAADRATFGQGLTEAITASIGAGGEPATVRENLARWDAMPTDDWIDLLVGTPRVPAGTALAVLGGRERGEIRQVLRRDWPRLAAQAGIPADVAEELRVRGLGW